MRFDEVLRTFAEFFEEEGVRWAVAGGLADGAYGDLRHDMKVRFAIDEQARDRVTAFANTMALGVPTTITFVKSSHPLLRDTQTHDIAGVPLRIVAPSMLQTTGEGVEVDFGPPAFTFAKYLEALTLLTADRPSSREVGGPGEPFTL